MKRYLACSILVGITIAAVSLGCKLFASGLGLADSAGSDDSPPGLPAGALAPGFLLPSPYNETIELEALRGRPVLLNFFATWCGPCGAEMPALEELHQAYQPQGLAVLEVNVQESAAKVLFFASRYSLTFPIALDGDGQVSEHYRVDAFPTSYFIDAQGFVRHVHVGMLSQASFDEKVQTYLGLSLNQEAETAPPIMTWPAPTSAAAITSTPQPVGSQAGCVNTSALHARLGPGMNYLAVTGLHLGECYVFDGRSPDSAWLRLSLDQSYYDKRLWAAARYIDLDGNVSDLPVVL